MAKPAIQSTPISLCAATLTSGFWKTRQDTNRAVTLPMEHEQCRRTNRIGAFRLDWKPGQPNQPHHFWDSDLGKWIEAVGYSLATHPDPELEKAADEVIDLVVSAQQPDGYLNVFYTVVQPGKRWTNLRDMHELYCAGHLMEAAVAYYQGTGKRKLLDCLCRYADHIADTFGPGPNQKPGYCGHPEVELALVKLYRCTQNKRYLELANFFVTQRGQKPYYFDSEAQTRGDERVKWGQTAEYFQAHVPVVEQKTIEGHAVRALYLLSGAIDVAAETGNAKLLTACKRLFNNAVTRRMYITGGVGSSRHNERFTHDYDLPNETAYAETCANIALAFAAHRLFNVEPDGRYLDIMERALYNGVVSGVSISGDRFFYANPLAADHEALTTNWGGISAKRQEWFDCACCPPNIARFLAEFNQYLYSVAPDTLYVNLYASNKATLTIANQTVQLEQKTNYPWDEKVTLTLSPTSATTFTLALRLPGWCARPQVKLNGKPITAKSKFAKEKSGLLYLTRTWQAGDQITLTFPMPIQLIETNPHSRNNAGKLAVQRGPVVYCAEEVDNGPALWTYHLSPKTKFIAKYESKFLTGAVTLTAKAQQEDLKSWDDSTLYRPITTQLKPATLKLIPYCLWANRKPGRMLLWFPQA